MGRSDSSELTNLPLAPILGADLTDHRTLAPRLADSIRNAILQGVLLPGQRLCQEELAACLGVSRIPIREALRILEAEGSVKSSPHSGVFVPPLNPGEIGEIRDMLIPLKTLALRLAVPNMTSDVIRRAGKILDARDPERDPTRWNNLTRDFFTAIYEPAGRPRLLSYILSLHSQGARYIHRFIGHKAFRATLTRNTRLLLEACARGDAEAAVKQIQIHYDDAAEALGKILKSGSRRENPAGRRRGRRPGRTRPQGRPA